MSDKLIGGVVIGMVAATFINLLLTVFQGEQIAAIERTLQTLERQEEPEVTCSTTRDFRWYGIAKTEEISCGTN